jgi:hypothetical protein
MLPVIEETLTFWNVILVLSERVSVLPLPAALIAADTDAAL